MPVLSRVPGEIEAPAAAEGEPESRLKVPPRETDGAGSAVTGAGVGPGAVEVERPAVLGLEVPELVQLEP